MFIYKRMQGIKNFPLIQYVPVLEFEAFWNTMFYRLQNECHEKYAKYRIKQKIALKYFSLNSLNKVKY